MSCAGFRFGYDIQKYEIRRIQTNYGTQLDILAYSQGVKLKNWRSDCCFRIPDTGNLNYLPMQSSDGKTTTEKLEKGKHGKSQKIQHVNGRLLPLIWFSIGVKINTDN